ncbi:MAG: translation elongation factor Ts [Candidatus Pacebacteria bacterium CG_4_10_14_0_8_um_filter_42_14]|nr:MAG: translation elongation factor Ts [Candidatus Pacebacteria bacterium CG_4_10_14_0_8_um_filter_42_14]
MSNYTSTDVKKLREETGAGVMDCKKALEESKGDYKKAIEIVQARGMERAEKKQDRETKEGYVANYVHTNGKIAALVELLCETDFVARNEEFRALGQSIAMQVASMQPETVEELLEQEFIRDGKFTIDQLMKALSGKIGEKIAVARFVRYQVGE